METSNKPLSASRIKTLQMCSWQYWSKYHLRLPDKSNHGSLRGTICHAVFELLGNPKHKHHYTKIVKKQNIQASPAIDRMVLAYSKKYGIDDFENLDLVNQMILEGLNYDFFGDKDGKPTKSISEEKFDISVDEDGKSYRILGFIDKLYLFKRKKTALIRDFKTSKAIFSGKEYEDNMQDLMYCLAIKHLYPEYIKRKMEFLFLKFDCNNEGLLEMQEIDTDELEGFEHFLSEVQQIINNFNEKTAKSNLAYDQGYPKKEDGFAGKIVCGFADYAGKLKKDGTPMWHCPFKFAFDYYHLLDDKGSFLSSAYDKETLQEKLDNGLGSEIKKLRYKGCPAFRVDNVSNLL